VAQTAAADRVSDSANLGNVLIGISAIAEDAVFLETAEAFLGLSRTAIAPSRGLGPASRMVP
jgi:hypothetical protein